MSNEDQQPADRLETPDEFDQAARIGEAERAASVGEADAAVGEEQAAAASGAQNADGGPSSVPDDSIVAAKIGELEELANERTADLQRLQAEYANYKKRVDRDRALSRQGGVEAVVLDLLPVLDSIEAASRCPTSSTPRASSWSPTSWNGSPASTGWRFTARLVTRSTRTCTRRSCMCRCRGSK